MKVMMTMMMNTYISWNLVWPIIFAVEFEHADNEIAMIKIIKILNKAHGTYMIEKNKLMFTEHFDLLDYKWSTSVIASEDKRYKVKSNEYQFRRIEQERIVIRWLLNNVNEQFDSYDDIFLKVFFDRNFLNLSVEKIKSKYNLSNKKYYMIIEVGEYLFKRAWCLLTPPKELLDMIESS